VPGVTAVTGVAPVTGAGDAGNAVAMTVVAVAGKSAPVIVPEFARLEAPVEPVIVIGWRSPRSWCSRGWRKRDCRRVCRVREEVEATEGDQLTAPV